MDFIPAYLIDQLQPTITMKQQKTLTEMLLQLEECINRELDYYEQNYSRGDPLYLRAHPRTVTAIRHHEAKPA